MIKKIRIADLSYEEQVNAINEVKLLSQMDSPFVVRYFDSFLTKESLHIVMEYCNKGDVQSLLKKAKSKNLTSLRESLVWNIGLQMILGLYYIHRKKILHRDLKTANVFLEKKSGDTHYKAKIGDLGVAKLLDTSTAFAQTIIGTPYYLSPELCADQPYRDKSDCWALGVILYECVTLERPFDARNQCALILKIIQSPAPPIGPERNISKPLNRLIKWLLEKDPTKRPTVKTLLCEKYVREQLALPDNSSFELPPELKSLPLTNKLNPESENGTPRAQQTSRKSNFGSSTGSSYGQSGTVSSSAASTPRNNVAVLPSQRSDRVRGDRVRGSGTRVTSSIARERHQVRATPTIPPPISQSSPRRDELESNRPVPSRGSSREDRTVSRVRAGYNFQESDEKASRRQHNMNIVDDDTIDTVETYNTHFSEAKRMQFESESASAVIGKGRHEVALYNDDKTATEPVEEGEDEDEEEEVGEYNEDEFEDDADAKDDGMQAGVDAKQAQEGEIVRRLNKATNSSHNVLQGAHNSAISTDDQEEEDREESKDDNDPYVLECLIDEYRQKSLDLLGPAIFQQVYELCSQFMMEDFKPENEEEAREHRLASTALLNVSIVESY